MRRRTWMIAVSLVPSRSDAAIDDRALALLDRLVLHAEARDAAEHPGAVRLPVHEVVVVAVGRGADVAVGLGGRRRVVADVGALALDVQRDLLAVERPRPGATSPSS